MREVPVALQVVRRHDGERRDATIAATPQCLSHEAEGGARHGTRLQIGVHRGIRAVELARDVVDVVSALRHGERDDSGRGRCHGLDDSLRIVGREEVLDDGPDDPWLIGAVGMLHDQRVEAVLDDQRLLHPKVCRHHADSADPPVQCQSVVHQPVVIHRLVGPMKGAHAEMHDAGDRSGALVGRDRQVLPQGGEGGGAEGYWHRAASGGECSFEQPGNQMS